MRGLLWTLACAKHHPQGLNQMARDCVSKWLRHESLLHSRFAVPSPTPGVGLIHPPCRVREHHAWPEVCQVFDCVFALVDFNHASLGTCRTECPGSSASFRPIVSVKFSTCIGSASHSKNSLPFMVRPYQHDTIPINASFSPFANHCRSFSSASITKSSPW